MTPHITSLPPARTDGGQPLMQALKNRRSSREFSSRPLPLQLMSDLLWAAFGINRPETGGRTAPSARHWEDIDIYVAGAQGVDVYDAHHHVLRRVVVRDVRACTGMQPFVTEAPLDLVYVSDHSRMAGATPDEQAQYSYFDAGFIAQNVYLFCASCGLATVVRAMIDRPALASVMNLTNPQHILLAQTVGFPRET
ncbi:MAG TPA: nitroreductase family protein [Burkholderiales bacterium]|nr:nitroreductase family protein [Burkholderiales bacterium]